MDQRITSDSPEIEELSYWNQCRDIKRLRPSYGNAPGLGLLASFKLEIRNARLRQTIVEGLAGHQKVLVIYGGAHLLQNEKALRELE